jgi:hypothetical protein
MRGGGRSCRVDLSYLRMSQRCRPEGDFIFASHLWGRLHLPPGGMRGGPNVFQGAASFHASVYRADKPGKPIDVVYEPIMFPHWWPPKASGHKPIPQRAILMKTTLADDINDSPFWRDLVAELEEKSKRTPLENFTALLRPRTDADRAHENSEIVAVVLVDGKKKELLITVLSEERILNDPELEDWAEESGESSADALAEMILDLAWRQADVETGA